MILPCAFLIEEEIEMEKINQKFVNKELNLSLDVYRDDGRDGLKLTI